MNLKKYMRLKAEKDTENLLTEEDELFIQKLVQEIEEKNKQEKAEKLDKKKKKRK